MGMGTLDPRLEDIFARAMEIAAAKERTAFVERARGGDEGPRQQTQFSGRRTPSEPNARRSVTASVARPLLLLPLLLLLTAPAQAEDYSSTTNNGTITITGYTGSGGAITIPNQINNLPVTSIGNWAFSACASLTSVTIPNSVTFIGQWAFAFCPSLTGVTIGNSVISIGNQAFSQCTSLAAINVDALNPGYSSLDGVLFNKSQTTLTAYPGGKAGSYSVPNSVTSIGDEAFLGCASLTSVTIPDSLISIGIGAFHGCTSLTSVTLGHSVTSIGDWAFYRCTSLTSLSIPDSVTTIGSQAFADCASLTSVTLGHSVTSIGVQAFSSCTNLTSVTLGPSVTSIGAWAFYRCTSLTSLSIPDRVTSIGDEAFASCTNLSTVSFGTSVTRIGVRAFSSCTSLASVTIPDRVTSIGGEAFSGCTSLTNLTIPTGVTTIGDGAFCSCTSLASVTIPDSVTSIGGEAFFGCTRLTSVSIPNSVTTIGGGAFCSCTSLSAITVDPNNSAYSSVEGVLFNKSTNTLIQCPGGKAGNYTIPNTATSIGESAFASCTSLTALYFEGNAPSVGYAPFDTPKNPTVYRLPGTTGWGPTFGDRPTALWKPLVQTSDASFGVRADQFGFKINWARDRVVVVEASTSLAHPTWLPLGTNTLADGWAYYSDPDWTNHPTRFYRLRSP